MPSPMLTASCGLSLVVNQNLLGEKVICQISGASLFYVSQRKKKYCHLDYTVIDYNIYPNARNDKNLKNCDKLNALACRCETWLTDWWLAGSYLEGWFLTRLLSLKGENFINVWTWNKKTMSASIQTESECLPCISWLSLGLSFSGKVYNTHLCEQRMKK